MTAPHSERYWHELETWSRDRIAELQLVKLREQLSYVHTNSDFYRAQWDDLGFDPRDLRDPEDLRKLPLISKADYVASLAERPPWGTAVAAAEKDRRRVHFSSGTTSGPTPVLWTQHDLDRWADLYARSAYSQGIRDTDVYQCLFGYAWFVGGLGATAGYERIGATVMPAGSSETQRQIDTMFRYGTTAVSGTPSFMLHLAETAEANGTPLSTSSVRRIQVGGEPGAGVPATRAHIEQRWGAKCFDGYGSLEFQPIAWECEEQAGGHIAEDFAYAEVLDPETHEPVPDGTPGVLVLTHLDKQATPLVRWMTGDIVVRDSARCGCGRTLARLPGGVVGRADDMLVVRGVNLFPSAVEQVVRRTPGTCGEYLIVLDDDVTDPVTGYLTGIKLRVEVEADCSPDLAHELARAVRAELTVRAVVEVLPEGTLPRSTHKSKRVIRAN
ncbi:AMP-binding protein [Micromonospora sp. 4G57]|uniref:AMP-binding protein n=1 Tax=Micromonospora sicca TaxID=2202420 RepID=A0ABU5JLI4_9ACTN|nr:MULTISPECIES: AMP-binding protein [unclassified Micromonospora]MDZ5446370.1 AMP-binding protein [Micromonospora sp. 4G57]MDZ5493441.1 AMP-binding protein [Micromonospora sp. 4G53]